MKERIVLACAGGVETLAAIPSLAEEYGAEVVTLTLDLGQERDLEEIRDRALAGGAARAHVLDAREEFAHDFVLPALQAGALDEANPPMAAALAWPIIAKKLLEIASIEQATAIAHGCLGVDRDCMDGSVRALNADIRVVAARAAAPSYSTHANLCGRFYAETKPPPEPPDMPASVVISFERGVPAAINGVPMALTELIESLSIIAGQHGVGRIAVAESGAAGASVRHVYEAPAAIVLQAAHMTLEALVERRELTRAKPGRAFAYAHLVLGGLWFTGMRGEIDAFNAEVQQRVTGSVRIKLSKGTLVTSEAATFNHTVGPRT